VIKILSSPNTIPVRRSETKEEGGDACPLTSFARPQRLRLALSGEAGGEGEGAKPVHSPKDAGGLLPRSRESLGTEVSLQGLREDLMK